MAYFKRVKGTNCCGHRIYVVVEKATGKTVSLECSKKEADEVIKTLIEFEGATS
jgi:hypothetical protein